MDDAFVCKLAEEARRLAEDFSVPVVADIAVRVCAHLDPLLRDGRGVRANPR